ncbi:hypothetical protein D9M72_378440 [compost metagenome]
MFDGKAAGYARHGRLGRGAGVVQAESAVAAGAVEMAVLAVFLRARGLMLDQAEAEHAVVAGALLRHALLDQPVQHAVHGDAVDGLALLGQAVDHGLVGQRFVAADQAGQDAKPRLGHARAQLAQALVGGFEDGGRRSSGWPVRANAGHGPI